MNENLRLLNRLRRLYSVSLQIFTPFNIPLEPSNHGILIWLSSNPLGHLSTLLYSRMFPSHLSTLLYSLKSPPCRQCWSYPAFAHNISRMNFTFKYCKRDRFWGCEILKPKFIFKDFTKKSRKTDCMTLLKTGQTHLLLLLSIIWLW